MTNITKPKVLIVGGGIGGVTLGAILERAEIPYEIFEKASALKFLGSAMAIGAPVVPMLKQLGVFEKLKASSVPMSGSVLLRERDFYPLIETDYFTGVEEGFGSTGYIIARPKLHGILLDLIPPERYHLKKRVVSYVETSDGVAITTSDNMTYEGHILVGADGAYSAIRQLLYDQLDKKGELPPSDKEPLGYSNLCLIGQTKQNPKGYKFPEDGNCLFKGVRGDTKPYFASTFATAERTACWIVVEFLDKRTTKDESSNSGWGPEAVEEMCNKVKDFPIANNGLTMGDIIAETPKETICKVMLEEKLFETWNSGRVVLLGDACHKMTPNAGLGAQSSMCDAAVLANYIYSLASIETKVIEEVCTAYKNERYFIVKSAVETSSKLNTVLKSGIVGDILRVMLKFMPRWLWLRTRARDFKNRPQIAFLPLAEDKGSFRPLYQPSLYLTRPQATANDTAATAL